MDMGNETVDNRLTESFFEWQTPLKYLENHASFEDAIKIIYLKPISHTNTSNTVVHA